MSTTTATAPPRPAGTARTAARRAKGRRKTSLLAHGEPMVWLTGGALILALLMITSLLAAVVWFGTSTFWPRPIEQYTLRDGRSLLGEVTRDERFQLEPDRLDALTPPTRAAADAELAAEGSLGRFLLRTGNQDVTGAPYTWIASYNVESEERPPWALLLERVDWGRFYGVPVAFTVDGEKTAEGSEAAWAAFQEELEPSKEHLQRIRALEKGPVASLNRAIEGKRLAARSAELAHGAGSPEHLARQRELADFEPQATRESEALREEITELHRENERLRLVMRTADGEERGIVAADVVRAVPCNRLSLVGKIGVYLSRWWEFVSAAPRFANTEGGVLPAIFGTIVMTLIMTVLVVPFGVLAALYLREYARQGWMISIVRIAVNNLAGVPSIVFGVFGLAFFCYWIGGSIDELFFSAKLPSPTYGRAGLLWAALTLALLTLPVVIVASEEALAAVPNSMREGSYACGATKWQTIRRIVLPRAAPGILTGAILAIARGAGEVAPLMLVGVVKSARDLAVDGVFPYVHPERSFMHLGFHIFDLGFQSPDSESAKPMVFTTTLLLISIVVALNVAAIGLRARLRRRFSAGHV